MAEHIAAAALRRSRSETATASAAIRVTSAGTHAWAGEPMHPLGVAALAEVGIDGRSFRSRQLTAALLDESTLVLAATRQQRAYCASLRPPALRRTFTLRQFARLAPLMDRSQFARSDPGERVALLVEHAVVVRGLAAHASVEDDDLADPVTGTLDDFRACVRQIQQSLRPMLALISGS
jgi:protein-tyrosine phosphatase